MTSVNGVICRTGRGGFPQEQTCALQYPIHGASLSIPEGPLTFWNTLSNGHGKTVEDMGKEPCYEPLLFLAIRSSPYTPFSSPVTLKKKTLLISYADVTNPYLKETEVCIRMLQAAYTLHREFKEILFKASTLICE